MLPIEKHLPELKQALATTTNVVLQAPPGAGKTTCVPLALLNESWLQNRKIIILEPRRLAARAAAYRMADMLNEQVGQTVGYRIRLDSKVGPKTRIEVVTEGILTRQMQNDPSLANTGLILFDEFHERSVHADLGLALTLDMQHVLRDDLRVLVMSATLDGERVAALMGDAPIITGTGRSYPVTTNYLSLAPTSRRNDTVVSAILRALKEEDGSILVFLPGAGSIEYVNTALRAARLPDNIQVTPLYGSLSREAQDAAITPASAGIRKIVLATSIAETSLTIEGIRVVIDSGQMRIPRFDPGNGMTRLETVKVSRASADQRRGRAGRIEAGSCYRLWTENEHALLEAFTAPEIRNVDLTPLAVELAVWGVADPVNLRWLDQPPTGTFAQARELLTELGAVDCSGSVTDHGRQMAAFGTHPRLAHMMLKANAAGTGSLACELAALLSERDIIPADAMQPDRDIRTRLDILHAIAQGKRDSVDIRRANYGACRRILDAARVWKRKLQAKNSPGQSDEAGTLLAWAYPDRIARRRPDSRTQYLLSNGRGAYFREETPLSDNEYLVAAHLDGGGSSSCIMLAASISRELVIQQFSHQIQIDTCIQWNRTEKVVSARRQTRLFALVLKDEPLRTPDEAQVITALLEGLREEGMSALPWNKDTRSWQARVQLLQGLPSGTDKWPDVSDTALLETMEHWLSPYLAGITSIARLQKIELHTILQSLLTWPQQQKLDTHAPTHITVPSGSHIPITYEKDALPVLAVRIQEVFGMKETSRIAGGAVPVVMQLLSPARRPAQVTQDLASFWQTGYFAVKKELKGRYPKHYWPDDPLQAEATRRTKRRMKGH